MRVTVSYVGSFYFPEKLSEKKKVSLKIWVEIY